MFCARDLGKFVKWVLNVSAISSESSILFPLITISFIIVSLFSVLTMDLISCQVFLCRGYI